MILIKIGNALSTGLWMFAASFEVFLLSRVVAGLTESNVGVSLAMLSDITTPEEKSKSMVNSFIFIIIDQT